MKVNFEAEVEFNRENPDIGKSLSNENKRNIINHDSKTILSPISKYENESDLLNSPNQEDLNENELKITKGEIESLIDNKRSELDIKLFNLVNKNQIDEKKIEELCNKETDQEKKAILWKNLEEDIKSNENNLALIKQYYNFFSSIFYLFKFY